MRQVHLAEQVLDLCGSLAPGPRRELRLALRALARERGDIKSLEGKLAGYQRVRCGPYRVIFKRTIRDGQPQIECVFAEHRALVYEVFTASVASGLGRKEE